MTLLDQDGFAFVHHHVRNCQILCQKKKINTANTHTYIATNLYFYTLSGMTKSLPITRKIQSLSERLTPSLEAIGQSSSRVPGLIHPLIPVSPPLCSVVLLSAGWWQAPRGSLSLWCWQRSRSQPGPLQRTGRVCSFTPTTARPPSLAPPPTTNRPPFLLRLQPHAHPRSSAHNHRPPSLLRLQPTAHLRFTVHLYRAPSL